MATRAELQKAVDDTTVAASKARGAWREAIPDENAPKMTDKEQAEVDDLEGKYVPAKAARKAAERALNAWVPPVVAPVADTMSKWDKLWIETIAGKRGLTDKAWADTIAGPRPAGWQGVF